MGEAKRNPIAIAAKKGLIAPKKKRAGAGTYNRIKAHLYARMGLYFDQYR